MGPLVFLGALTADRSTFLPLGLYSLISGPLCVLVQGLPQFKNLMVWKQEFLGRAFPRVKFSGDLSTSSWDSRSRSDLQIQKVHTFGSGGEKHVYLVWSSEIVDFGFQSCKVSRKK